MKAAMENVQVTCKERAIRITQDFPTQTIKDRSTWADVIRSLRGQNGQPRLLYPAKFSMKIE